MVTDVDSDDEWIAGQRAGAGQQLAAGLGAVALTGGAIYGAKKWIDGKQAPPIPAKPEEKSEREWSKGKIAAVVGGSVAAAAAVGYGVHKYKENKGQEEREREEKRRREEERRRREEEEHRRRDDHSRLEKERREKEKAKVDPDAGLSDYERGMREHQRQIAAHLKMEEEYRSTLERR